MVSRFTDHQLRLNWSCFKVEPNSSIFVQHLQGIIIIPSNQIGKIIWTAICQAILERTWQHKNVCWLLTSKLQQFWWKGKSKQHVAHFVETCNNVGVDRTSPSTIWAFIKTKCIWLLHWSWLGVECNNYNN